MSEQSQDATSDHRLPRSVIPTHYELELAPDLDDASFEGRVRISCVVHEATDRIVLNAAELTPTSATWFPATPESAAPDAPAVELTAHIDHSMERLTLRSATPLEPGPIIIDIAFDGVLNDKLRGFYRSTFVDDTGAERTIATTQFESTNARRAFPCWDEPDLKATFGVTLLVPSDLLAISSGPELTRKPIGDGRDRVVFGPTMKMSTYLLAFVVGPLEATPATDVDGVPLRVVYPPGMGHLTSFALEVGAFSLRHFSDYFEIPYPGNKLDLVGIPDFAFGAMENLGCVTFREALLLLDENETTQPEQQRVADVIAHEIAHMWFGDLVTMKWWDGIWLKEAFATFCEMHATDALRPTWNRWDDFSLSRTAAFDIDSLTTTRPIEFEVISPDDAEAMYDVLTYEKGAAVVRMLEQYLGEDQFRDGIRHYLQLHSYGNTDTHDLWDALEASTGQPARQIMDSWILQGGYPMVSAELISPTVVRFRQLRFRYLPDETTTPTWSVPLVLAVGHGETRRRQAVLLDGPQMDVDLGPEPVSWLAGNADASGFYRMRNIGDLLQSNLAALQHFSPAERYGLVDDTWAGFVAGHTDAQAALDVLHVVGGVEDETSVWRRVLGILRSVDHHLDGDAAARHRSRTLDLILPALERLGHGTAEDMDQRTELRAALFETAGVLGDPRHIEAARELLATTSSRKDDTPDDPAHHAAAIRIVAANGTPDDFAEFVRRYQSAETPQEERRYLFALPMFPHEAELRSLLELLDSEQVRSQDGGYVLGSALSQGHPGAVWQYIESNWELLTDRYPDNSIPRMIQGAQSVGDPEVADAIGSFFDIHELPQAGQTLFQHLERMRVTVDVRRRLRAQLG